MSPLPQLSIASASSDPLLNHTRESLLPCQVACPQIPEIRRRTALGGHSSASHSYALLKIGVSVYFFDCAV